MLVEPPGASNPTLPAEYGGGPISVVFSAVVTAAMVWFWGELAVVLKAMSPARLPTPERTSWMKSESASRAASIFVRPVPSCSDMLPERSKTTITSRVIGVGGAGAMSWSADAVG